MMDDVGRAVRGGRPGGQACAATPPLVSSVTGAKSVGRRGHDPAYWSRHLREPVRFSPALRCLLGEGERTLIECGPRPTLSGFVRQHAERGHRAPVVVATLEESPAPRESLLLAAGRLWTLGVRSRGAVARRGQAPDCTCPTYPFERNRHWVSSPSGNRTQRGRASRSPEAAIPLPAVRPTAAPPTENSPAPYALHPMMINFQQRPGPRIVSPNSLPDCACCWKKCPASTLRRWMRRALRGVGARRLRSSPQAALQVRKDFKVDLTFRPVMERFRTLELLARHLDQVLPADPRACCRGPSASSATCDATRRPDDEWAAAYREPPRERRTGHARRPELPSVSRYDYAESPRRRSCSR